MSIAAKISSAELTAQVTDRFAGQSFEARLINTPGVSYEPGITVDATFLGFEVAIGTGGYDRQVIGYTLGDVSNYSDDGVALTTKATIFAQDGSATSIPFTHVALVWSSGNTSTLASVGTAPSTGVDGTYTNIPIDSTNGTGRGLTVDLTITNNGASSSDYSLSVANSGYGYESGDVLSILEGTLAGLGAVTAGAGPLGFAIGTVDSSSNAGNILSVARTSSAVNLTAGNEAIFYWNLKQFGYYSA
jgi:hypothetical protein